MATTVETFANLPSTTVSSGGTTAPVAGTQETWTVASSASFPAANSGATPPTQFHVADQASGKTSEIIAVTLVSGATWTVTRGAENTTPVAHTAGFTIYQVVTAGGLTGLLQSAASLSDVASAATARTNLGLGAAAVLGTPVPVADGGTGQGSQQAALDALAGAVTANQVLAGNGTHVTLRALAPADLPSNGAVPLAWMPAVVITLDAQVFSPSLTLAAGSTATLHWVYNGAVAATGVNPTITGPASGSWTVRLYATDTDGFSALDQVSIFNIGYASLDTGPWSPSASYNYPAQPVTGIQGLNAMTGLTWFLAQEVTGLAGTLDFTGMSSLTVADMHCLDASQGTLSGVNLSGCTSLQRLGVEACSLSELDLTPVLGCLRDLRAAIQTTSSLNLKEWNTPLTGQYHFCVRNNYWVGASLPGYAPNLNETDTGSRYLQDLDYYMPNITQLYIWGISQQGKLTHASPFLNSVQAYQNWYAGADFSAGAFRSGVNNDSCTLDMHQNQLTSVSITGCVALGNIDLHQNPLSQATVDAILAEADSWGTSGKTLNLQDTAAPSVTGTAHVTSLRGKSWTVTVDSSGAPGGGFGTKFTYGESAVNRYGNGTGPLQARLALAVNSGDLLIAAIETTSTPAITDDSGNTWVLTGPFNTYTYLAYCLSAAAASGGVLVSVLGGAAHGLAVSRFTPAGAVTFGGGAHSSPGAGGTAENPANNLGDLGVVPADALAWGVFVTDNTGGQDYTAGYQAGTSGTPDFIGAAWQNSAANPQGSAVILYAYCANSDAALTWTGGGTGAGGNAVSAYFTSA